MAALKFYLKRRNCHAYIFFAWYLFLPFLHNFIYIYIYIFSIRAFFHRHWQFIGQQGKGGHIFYSTLRIPLTHEHSDICLQLCMWYDYYVFLISMLVIVYSINSRKVFSSPTTKNISFVSRPRFAKFQFHFYQVMEAGKKGSGAVVHSPIWNLNQWKALVSAIQKPVNHKTFSEKSLEKVSPIKYISQGLFRA